MHCVYVVCYNPVNNNVREDFGMKTYIFLASFICMQMYANTEEVILEPSYNPKAQARVSIMTVENKSKATFKLFYGPGEARALLLPGSVWQGPQNDVNQKLVLNQEYPIQIVCVKGSYLDMFIQDRGMASGTIDDGFDGPYYLTMWLQYPQVAMDERVHVPYAIKKNSTGHIALQIDEHGHLRIIAQDNFVLVQ